MRIGLRRILVGTDFSRSAGQVLSRAGRLARLSGAELEVMHVATGERLGADAELLAGRGASSGAATAMAKLRLAALQIGERFAVPVHLHLAYGKPHVEIAARAVAINADLLVLGARGERALRDMLLGSTIQRMQRRLQTPLLIVRDGSLANYRRVLVAIDFSPASAEAAGAAARLFPGAALHFLHVCNVLFEGRLARAGVAEESIRSYRNQVLLDASRELDRFLREQGLQPRRSSASVRHGYPPACIKEAAADVGASLIALGTKGKSRFEAELLGSVSEQFVNATTHDVLLVKPAGVGVTPRVLDLPGESAMRVSLHES